MGEAKKRGSYETRLPASVAKAELERQNRVVVEKPKLSKKASQATVITASLAGVWS